MKELDFLAVLSHELRNPLSALSNSLYVLAKCQMGDARAARAIALMERQIRHMTSLVDNLTEAARLGRGGFELHVTKLNLTELVRTVCQDLEYLFVLRDLELHKEIPERALLIWADATRLTQVLGNLLQNAAQFTPSGGHVVVGIEPDPAAPRVRLRVRDTGIGLDAELRQRLFRPFMPADNPLVYTRGGLGLGLALIKGIVDLHGGSVWAESEGPGRGSTFVVELPWPGWQRPGQQATEASSA